MQTEGFRKWLNENGYLSKVISSRISNCERVCQYEGDLDKLYEKDKCFDLLNRLNYTSVDERNNLPPRHKIPINGNKRTGSATFKQAVGLYVKFKSNVMVSIRNNSHLNKNFVKTKLKQSWPIWDLPKDEEIYNLAQISTKYIRFLSPEIIKIIVNQNEQIRINVQEQLKRRGIDPQLYLWEKSSCCFPGVRRHAGSAEISAYRKKSSMTHIEDALCLDDNDFPKQIWSFIFRGTQFRKYGPDKYSLAHLIDHKKDNNRMVQEFLFPDNYNFKPLYGLYTCASNSVYIPNSLMKPTDFNGEIRNLLFRKAYDLYNSVCNIIPPLIKIPGPSSEKWNISNFEWAEPVGNLDNIDEFFIYRQSKMNEILESTKK